MRIDETVLYEQFVTARLEAVRLMDMYRDTPATDPRRGILWDRVVDETETARALLESWLRLGKGKPTANPAATVR